MGGTGKLSGFRLSSNSMISRGRYFSRDSEIVSNLVRVPAVEPYRLTIAISIEKRRVSRSELLDRLKLSGLPVVFAYQ